jgi:GNAT superfamily N-acetyltransferase
LYHHQVDGGYDPFPFFVMSIDIVQADLTNAAHQDAVVSMMDAYSRDPMGDDKPLSEFARNHLVDGLREFPTTMVLLAFSNNEACGIATCFRGFSTFAAKPLLNISDFYVVPSLRGKGIGQSLLAKIECEARRMDCCKLTLEVQENNANARLIYGRFGFKQAVYAADAQGGGSLYMVKSLNAP